MGWINGWMEYHFLIHKKYVRHFQETSPAKVVLVFGWKIHISHRNKQPTRCHGEVTKGNPTNPWTSSHPRWLVTRSILMKNWWQADHDPMLMGGATEHIQWGETPFGETKAGLRRQKWRIQDDNSRFWSWVMSCWTVKNHVRGRQCTLWLAVRPFGVYLGIEDLCPTIRSWQVS